MWDDVGNPWSKINAGDVSAPASRQKIFKPSTSTKRCLVLRSLFGKGNSTAVLLRFTEPRRAVTSAVTQDTSFDANHLGSVARQRPIREVLLEPLPQHQPRTVRASLHGSDTEPCDLADGRGR